MLLDDLKQAIMDHNIIEIKYDKDPLTRIIEPHTIGINLKRNIVLSAYQIAGYSSSDKIKEWKLFDIKKIKSYKIFNQIFDIRKKEGFNPYPSKKMFVRIIQQIK